MNVESEFTARLKELLKQHGATLRRLGQDAAFEKSERFAEAWDSFERWRDKVWPTVDLAMGRQADAAAMPAALQALNQFLADFPRTPYRARVEELIRRIDPASQAPIWTAERIRGALSDHFYSGLEEVPFTGGERFFYRRPSPADRDPMHRAVENMADLVGNPDRLNAYLPRPGDQLLGGTRPSVVSAAWGQLEQALSAAEEGEVQGLMLDLLERLRTLPQGDAFFRLRALRDLAVVLKQSGQTPPVAEKPLDEWLGRCGRFWSEALSVDWLSAAYATPADIRTLRSQAANALSEFPKLVQIAEAAREERERATRELRPLAPIGVLLSAEAADVPRQLGQTQPDGPVVLVIEGPGGFRFLETRLQGGKIAASSEIPSGPVLVFRRTGS